MLTLCSGSSRCVERRRVAPPARRSARNWIRRVQRVFFFRPRRCATDSCVAGLIKGAPLGALARGGFGATPNASGPPTQTRTSLPARISARHVVGARPAVPPPHSSLFLTTAPVVRQLCEGGCATAGRSARPRPPDLPPRASRSTRDILDRTRDDRRARPRARRGSDTAIPPARGPPWFAPTAFQDWPAVTPQRGVSRSTLEIFSTRPARPAGCAR